MLAIVEGVGQAFGSKGRGEEITNSKEPLFVV